MVECRSTGNKFQLALCYGRNHLQDRRQLWDSLINNTDQDLPLIVCGDLNNVMEVEERVGGRPPIEREIRELVDTAAYLNLVDAPSTGTYFTWTNGTIFSRIDRFMYNNSWLDEGWTIKSHFHTRGARFDHSPCTAELFNPIKRFKRDFKFCNFWNEDSKFQDILRGSWSVEGRACNAQLKLTLKLKQLRRDLSSLKRREFSNIEERAEAARKQLQTIQERVDKDPLNAELRMEELQIHKSCKFLNKAEISFLAQRAKSLNLNNLDKNSKYFHSIVKSSFTRNSIAFIRRSDGSVTGDMKTIIDDFVDFYQNLFGVEKQRIGVDWTVF